MMLETFTKTVIEGVNAELASGIGSTIQEKIERVKRGILTEDEMWQLILASYVAGVKQK